VEREPVGAASLVAPFRSGSRQVRPPCVGCLPAGGRTEAARVAGERSQCTGPASARRVRLQGHVPDT